MILRSPLRNGGTTTWRRAHRPTTDREPELRVDRYKYGYRTCRMIIPTMVRRSELRGDVTLAAVVWMGRGLMAREPHRPIDLPVPDGPPS